ncbi:MAG: tyrosine-type recombinase/integrase [Terriglobia bacterium]|nr:tyrosine-type recombinase/integrase [Terriglobia bacterium]
MSDSSRNKLSPANQPVVARTTINPPESTTEYREFAASAIQRGQDYAAGPFDARTVTYSQLVERVIENKGQTSKRKNWGPTSTAARDFRSRANTFCKKLGRSPQDRAKLFFDERFAERLVKVTEQIGKQSKAKAYPGKNVKWAAEEVREAFEKLKSDGNLPLDFADSLQAAMNAKGLTPTALINLLEARFGAEHHGIVYNYLRRKHHPRTKMGVEVVARLEIVLGLNPGVLHTRAFSEPALLKSPSADPNPYRLRQSQLSDEPYVLKDMPEQFDPLWPQIVEWRSRPSHLLENGHTVEIKAPWKRKATERMNRYYLIRFMSFLHLGASDKPQYEMTVEDRWRIGKGKKVSDLRFADWFNVVLQYDYVQFRRARQWNGEQTAECIDFVNSVSLLCKYDYSFLQQHPELAREFDQEKMAPNEWRKYVKDNIYTPIANYLKDMRHARPSHLSRKPEDPLRHVLYDHDPLYLMLRMLRQMEFDLCAKKHEQHYALELRDIALLWILCEIPLRARNLYELTLGGTTRFDEETGLWWIDIPKEDLKNHLSKSAQAIHRPLSAEASSALQRYVSEGRPVLDPNDSSKILFLVQRKAGKKKKSRIDLGLTQTALERIISKYLLRYFGVSSGPHFFRHLLATAILRANPDAIEAAAAVLNVSPAVVRKRYAHLLQQDGLDRANAFMAEKRRMLKDYGGRAPPPKTVGAGFSCLSA